MDMQLSKLEFEIKLQKLTNELQELKKKCQVQGRTVILRYTKHCQKAVSQACRKAQDTSDMLAFPIVELIDQQSNIEKQYHTLVFKVIKELKTAVVQYGPTAPFTQALLDTVMESNLTPQDWKTLCKATLSGGDFLLWSSECCEASKRTAMMNAQTGKPDWYADMLLGEGQYESNANQTGFPVGVYTQVAMAGH